MNLKYATLGLISGYLAGYVQEYLQTKNSADFTTTLSDEEETTKYE